MRFFSAENWIHKPYENYFRKVFMSIIVLMRKSLGRGQAYLIKYHDRIIKGSQQYEQKNCTSFVNFD